MPSPYDDADARRFVESAAAGWAGGAAHFAVEEATGRLAAAITLWIVRPGIGEVGYWAVQELRGRGYTTHALALLAEWALREVGLERLQLGTLPGNRPSERVAEKVGFRREGTLRAYVVQRGERRDVSMWSLLPGELAL